MDIFCECGLCNLHCSFHKPRNLDTSLNCYGFFGKTGGSTADDVVNYCVYQLTLFALSYHEAFSIVTDTEPTKIAAGRVFVQRSLNGGENKMARMY